MTGDDDAEPVAQVAAQTAKDDQHAAEGCVQPRAVAQLAAEVTLLGDVLDQLDHDATEAGRDQNRDDGVEELDAAGDDLAVAEGQESKESASNVAVEGLLGEAGLGEEQFGGAGDAAVGAFLGRGVRVSVKFAMDLGRAPPQWFAGSIRCKRQAGAGGRIYAVMYDDGQRADVLLDPQAHGKAWKLATPAPHSNDDSVLGGSDRTDSEDDDSESYSNNDDHHHSNDDEQVRVVLLCVLCAL